MIGAGIGGIVGGAMAYMEGASREEIAMAAFKGAVIGGVVGLTGGAAGAGIFAVLGVR